MKARRAFTLVELMAATALASVLMVAVLQITASLNLSRRVILQGQRSSDWHRMLIEQLEDDLQNARAARLDQGQLVVETLMQIDESTFQQHHRPTQVRYRFEKQTASLLRHQVDLLDRTNRQDGMMLLAADVRVFSTTLFAWDTRQNRWVEATQAAEEGFKVRLAVEFNDPAVKPVQLEFSSK